MDKQRWARLEEYMLLRMQDSAHDRQHVYRVLNNALVIAETEPAVNYDVLLCACLLHDIGRPDQLKDPTLCHAAVGSEKAYRFLLDNAYPEAFAQHVRSCIRTHRFRKNDQPQSLEARILFDADKLDVVGAIGIARTLVYKGTVSDPLYTRTPDGKISDGTNEEPSSFFREYKFKLENLYDRFYTETGARLAEQRRDAAVSFYQNLYAEVTAFDDFTAQHLPKILDV